MMALKESSRQIINKLLGTERVAKEQTNYDGTERVAIITKPPMMALKESPNNKPTMMALKESPNIKPTMMALKESP